MYHLDTRPIYSGYGHSRGSSLRYRDLDRRDRALQPLYNQLSLAKRQRNKQMIRQAEEKIKHVMRGNY